MDVHYTHNFSDTQTYYYRNGALLLQYLNRAIPSQQNLSLCDGRKKRLSYAHCFHNSSQLPLHQEQLFNCAKDRPHLWHYLKKKKRRKEEKKLIFRPQHYLLLVKGLQSQSKRKKKRKKKVFLKENNEPEEGRKWVRLVFALFSGRNSHLAPLSSQIKEHIRLGESFSWSSFSLYVSVFLLERSNWSSQYFHNFSAQRVLVFVIRVGKH